MRKALRNTLEKYAKKVFNGIADIIDSSPARQNVKLWRADNGDKTLRLDYDLDQESIVFDLGGYEGQWSSDIFSRYCCTIHCFEPVKDFANNIKKRFLKNNKIIVHQLGLSDSNKKEKISNDSSASSIFKGNGKEEIQLVKAIEFIAEQNLKKIDLIKINIQGGEYDLLEHLIETGFIVNIGNIQIQFHDFVDNARERMCNIQTNLAKTHKLTYQYEFVWENWQLK